MPETHESVSRYAGALVAALFFGAAAAWIHDAAGRHIQDADSGEIATLARAAGAQLPPETSEAGAGAGETTAWFAKLLYPGGVFYMNARMGGGADMYRRTGWEADWWTYPGGYYLRKHFERADRLSQDPNIQDFAFFMRLAFGLAAAACICLVLWELARRFGLAPAAAYGALMLGSPLVFEQLRVFYAETATFIVFHLAAFLYLRYGLSRPRRPPSLRTAVWLGGLSAAALSTGFSGVALAVLPACAAVAGVWGWRDGSGGRRGAALRIGLWLASLLAFLYLINVLAPGSVAGHVAGHVGGIVLDAWELLAGGRPPGSVGVAGFVASLSGGGWLFVPLFLAGLLWLASLPRRALVPVYALGAAAVLAVLLFPERMLPPARGLASIYVAASFVAAIAVGDLLERLAKWEPRWGRRWGWERWQGLAAAGAAPALMLAFLTAGAHLWWQTAPQKEAFFESVRRDAAECAGVAAIGFPDGDVQALREAAGGGEVAAFPRVPRFFHRRRDITYDEYKAQVFAGYQGYECLAVYREAHTDTKQVTNFFAPKYYRLRERIGDYFFFAARP